MSAPISTTIRTHEATGQRYAVNIYHDEGHDAPWESEDGHGPVRVSRRVSRACQYTDKRPGERPMHDNGAIWLYDWQAAMRMARTDKWGIDPEIRGVWTTVAQSRAQAAARGCYDFLGEWLAMSRGEIAERAVQADYDRLAGWLRDDWYYVGVAVVLLGDDDADGEPIPLTGRYDHALWGIESDSDDSYIDEVADDLLADALATRYTDAQIEGTEPAAPLLDDDAVARVNAYAEREGWALIDVDSTGLYEIERDDEAGRFASDDAAVAHVRRCTAAGSVLHSEALEMHDNDAAALSAHRAEPVADDDERHHHHHHHHAGA